MYIFFFHRKIWLSLKLQVTIRKEWIQNKCQNVLLLFSRFFLLEVFCCFCLVLFPPTTLCEEQLCDLDLMFYNPLFTACLKIATLLQSKLTMWTLPTLMIIPWGRNKIQKNNTSDHYVNAGFSKDILLCQKIENDCPKLWLIQKAQISQCFSFMYIFALSFFVHL